MLKCWKIATIEIDSLRDARKLIQLKLSRKLSRWIYCFFLHFFIVISSKAEIKFSTWMGLFMQFQYLSRIRESHKSRRFSLTTTSVGAMTTMQIIYFFPLSLSVAAQSRSSSRQSVYIVDVVFCWLWFRCKNNDQRSSKRSSAQMKTKILQMLRRQPWERWEMTRWGFSLVYSTVFPFSRSTWLRRDDDHVRSQVMKKISLTELISNVCGADFGCSRERLRWENQKIISDWKFNGSQPLT